MSGASPPAPAVDSHVARAAPVPGHPVVLNGSSADLVVVDRPGLAHVAGSGRMSGLGRVTISSKVNSKAETPLLSNPAQLYADLEVVTP